MSATHTDSGTDMPNRQLDSRPLSGRLPKPDAGAAEFARLDMGGPLDQRYQIFERLGEGLTAVTYRGYHTGMNLPVAIKVFRPTDGWSKDREAYLVEAQLMAKLDHPNIVRVIDAGTTPDDNLPYIVFEFVGEMTLAELIQISGRLTSDHVAQIGFGIGRALRSAWQHRLVHCDVKPSNIFIRKDGAAKLGDFGGVALQKLHGLRRDQCACYTDAYACPESIRGESVDHRSDMYGLGATLYTAATGQPPFVRDNPDHVIRAHLLEAPTPIPERVPGFPTGLDAVIRRMLAKDPADRYHGWRELLIALKPHTGETDL